MWCLNGINGGEPAGFDENKNYAAQFQNSPDLFHVVPVGDNAVLDGVLEGEDTTLGLGLVADVRVLLSHSDLKKTTKTLCKNMEQQEDRLSEL